MVRAKFRCLSHLKELSQQSVRMLPVVAKSESYPGGSEENQSYFKWTPSGELEARYLGVPTISTSEGVVEIGVGSYYYLDLTHDESLTGDVWNLVKVTQSSESIEVHFQFTWGDRKPPELRSGDLKMQINNPGAWDHFLGRAGTKWKMEIHPAPFSPGASYP